MVKMVNKLNPPGALPGLLAPDMVRTLEEAEVWLLSLAMCVHKGNLSRAAADLGISRHTIYRKVVKHRLDIGYYMDYNGPNYTVHPFPEPVLNAPIVYPAHSPADQTAFGAAHNQVTSVVTSPVNRKLPVPDWLDVTQRAVWSDLQEAFVHPDSDEYMWDGIRYFLPMPDDF